MNKDVRKTFVGNVSSLFRELPECTEEAEVEWLLFKAVVASTAARVCGRKRLVVANNGKKVTLWWDQDVKDSIRAKKVAYKVWLQNKANSSFHLRYAEARNPQPLR